MADINYNSEKSWGIKEKLPIPVSVIPFGRYFRIQVAPMLMSYETWQDIGDNWKLTDEQWESRKRQGMQAPDEDRQRTLQNDVSQSQYDYEDGSCTFTASTLKDVENWLELYKDKVVNSFK